TKISHMNKAETASFGRNIGDRRLASDNVQVDDPVMPGRSDYSVGVSRGENGAIEGNVMTTAGLAAPAGAGLRALPNLLQKTEGWETLRAALGANRSGTIDGAWGSAASLATSALAQDVPGTLLVVVPTPADVAPWVEDIVSFTGTRPTVFEAWE